jgi:hypothetical protein
MIQGMINLLFGCHHKSLTRPITMVNKLVPQITPTYVACLDCGKQFNYNLITMRMGAEILQQSDFGNNSRFTASP